MSQQTDPEAAKALVWLLSRLSPRLGTVAALVIALIVTILCITSIARESPLLGIALGIPAFLTLIVVGGSLLFHHGHQPAVPKVAPQKLETLEAEWRAPETVNEGGRPVAQPAGKLAGVHLLSNPVVIAGVVGGVLGILGFNMLVFFTEFFSPMLGSLPSRLKEDIYTYASSLVFCFLPLSLGAGVTFGLVSSVVGEGIADLMGNKSNRREVFKVICAGIGGLAGSFLMNITLLILSAI